MNEAPKTLKEDKPRTSPYVTRATSCYVIVEGKFYSAGYTLCVCKTKKVAVKKCRDDGFSYCRKDDLWSGEHYGDSYFRRIEREDFYT